MLQPSHLRGAEAFATEDGTKAIEKLLKLCSHFQATGEGIASAKEECHRIGEQKERQVSHADVRNPTLRAH